MRWNLILYKIGFSFFVMGLLLLLPLALDVLLEEGYWPAYVKMIAILAFFGTAFILSNLGVASELNLKETFVIILLVLFIACLTGAMPFVFILEKFGFVNGLFESIASLTTTAATVIKVYDPPQSLILWKGILQFFGGLGGLIYVMLFLPILKIGGMHIYNAGGVNLSGKLLPNAPSVIWQITKIYGILTLACVGLLTLGGIGLYDAVIHGLSAVSTTGFSPYKESIGYFDSYYVELVLILFMMLSALPFLVIMGYFQRARSLKVMQDPQTPHFITIVLCFFIVLFLWMFLAEDLKPFYSLRQSLFMTVSAFSTSGFYITNFAFLTPFTSLMILFAIYIGGCAGSTAGGVKIMRIIVVGKIMFSHFKKLRFRKAIFATKYGKRVIDTGLIHNVMGFLCLYVFTNVIISIALSVTGMDFISAISIAASMISNYGLALGDTTAVIGEYNFLRPSEKWVSMLGMLLGRLDIVAFFVLINIRYSFKQLRTFR